MKTRYNTIVKKIVLYQRKYLSFLRLLNKSHNFSLGYGVALGGGDRHYQAVDGGYNVFQAVVSLDVAHYLAGLDFAAGDGRLGGVVHIQLPQQLSLYGALHGCGLGYFCT